MVNTAPPIDIKDGADIWHNIYLYIFGCLKCLQNGPDLLPMLSAAHIDNVHMNTYA